MAINVLIVDDSAEMRAMTRKAVRPSGLRIGEIHLALEKGCCRIRMRVDGVRTAAGGQGGRRS